MNIIIESIKPEYIAIISASIVIIMSFIFNFISIKTNIPSVLLLIGLGVTIQVAIPSIRNNSLLNNSILIIGKVGLILIVLEAALDLKIKKNKIVLIIKSFIMALFGLLATSFIITFAIQFFLESSFYKSFVYAVSISILSSAIIIPSVAQLKENQKEFMIYESTFSDIIGIILFQFLVSPEEFYSTSHVVYSVTSKILITVFIAIAFGYLAVWAIQKLTSHVKLFLIIAVLLLVYSIGSIFHLSSLIIILLFGLILGNTSIFFSGILKNKINTEKIKLIFKEFYTITLESAFVLRTFFFVLFGITISLTAFLDYNIAIQSLVLTGIIFLVRFIILAVLLGIKKTTPQLFIAPRGLITILLFYTIPEKYLIENFNQGVLLYTILFTSLIMTIALIFNKHPKNISELLHNFDELHDSIEKSFEEGHIDIVKEAAGNNKLIK